MLFLLLLGASVSCQKDKVDVQSLPSCQTPFADIRRSNESVSNVSATIVVVSRQSQVYNIIPNGISRVPWGPCNLPQRFQKDSLRVLVSGYLLTSPFLELANVTPLSFEISAIELSK